MNYSLVGIAKVIFQMWDFVIDIHEYEKDKSARVLQFAEFVHKIIELCLANKGWELLYQAFLHYIYPSWIERLSVVEFRRGCFGWNSQRIYWRPLDWGIQHRVILNLNESSRDTLFMFLWLLFLSLLDFYLSLFTLNHQFVVGVIWLYAKLINIETWLSHIQ